jgi:capsular polysaccharide biosynthesis protein
MPPPRAPDATLEALTASTDALQDETRALQTMVAPLAAALDAIDTEVKQQVKAWRRDADERARLAAASGQPALADGLYLEGPPHRRAAVRRLSVGEPVATRFDQWMGVTRTANPAPDVRALWESLLARELEASDGLLRGAPAALVDVGPASIARDDPRGVVVTLLDRVPDLVAPAIALPRFTYHRMPRKLRNFGHWLLDFLPQVVALAAVAPRARVLLPEAVSRFHPATLGLVGIDAEQMQPWDGSPVTASRGILFQHDGRMGGGRPLSLLTAMHRALRAPAAVRGHRRLYVSRRDAKARRRWLANEAAVEAVFAARGFEILLMKDLSLDDQIRTFREAAIVAGTSGAGLSDIVFCAPGTDVIVIHTDRQMRWYADERSRRSTWMRAGQDTRDAELAELGDSPRFYAHLAAALSQHCHAFLAADEAPLEALAAFLDEVLAHADGRP